LIPDPRIDFLLSGDYVRLSQVLSNLLSNAIKFTSTGSVSLSYTLKEIKDKQASIIFSIQDTGIGIAPAQTARIFEDFSQADASISRKYGGTGLGLSISKKLVEAQGGTIGVESTPGQGARFFVELSFEMYQNEPAANQGAEPTKVATADLRGMRILVAEDNNVNILVLTGLLRKWGASYSVAKDGQEAIDWASKAPFDIILMDIQMPNVDGNEATLAIRQLPDVQKRSVPIIAFTAEASLESQQAFLELGFNGYITKPFQPEQLLAVLKKHQIGVN
jgi:CheY-like chemotaxis protein